MAGSRRMGAGDVIDVKANDPAAGNPPLDGAPARVMNRVVDRIFALL